MIGCRSADISYRRVGRSREDKADDEMAWSYRCDQPGSAKLQELSDDSGLGPSQEIQGSYHIPKLKVQRSRDVQRGMYVVAGGLSLKEMKLKLKAEGKGVVGPQEKAGATRTHTGHRNCLF